MAENKNNSEKYLTNPDGSYILNKDGSRRKKPGRPKNSELSDIKLASEGQTERIRKFKS